MTYTSLYLHDITEIKLSPQSSLDEGCRVQKLELRFENETLIDIYCFGCFDMAPIIVLLPEETPDA